MVAIPYAPHWAAEWNRLNTAADAGHFMFDRGFMEYHADRFADASMLLLRDGAPVGIFPANRDGARIHSHQGLTFGGIVAAPGGGVEDAVAMLDAVAGLARAQGAAVLTYKALPAIYHRAPAEAPLYALFRSGACCLRRELSATIDHRAPGPRSRRRERGLRRSARAGLHLGWDQDWDGFWAVLAEVLQRRHGRAPVHSAAEIRLLAGRFPDAIRLFTARDRDAVAGGVVLFQTPWVSHAQYIAASPHGQDLGALDAIFDRLIDASAATRRYFDFGISTEDGGRVLNTGLARYKQEWGCGTIVHDTFELAL